MEVEEAKRAVLEGARRLVASALVARTWGNISCRVGASHFVITPSGREYERLTEEQLVVVRLDDLGWEGSIKPSSEKGIHAAVYRERSDVNYVIHTHQEMASLASQLGEPLPVPPLYQDLLGHTITTAAYALPGTKALKERVGRLLSAQPHSALLMTRHGALCFGSGLDETYAIADGLETVCTEVIHARAPLLATFKEPPVPAILAKRTETGGVESCTGELKALSDALLDPRSPYSHILLLSSDEVITCMEKVQVLSAYLDDFAQIAGPKLTVMESSDALPSLLSAAKGRDALLIRGIGALCMGGTHADAEAVATLLQKNCKAALLALAVPSVKPLPLLDTYLMRFVYKKKYSKLAAATK
ncbi:MAG: class II aldolase/adducin family protein [Sphaerochaeta sp.]|nr:class II aldolase/adducin family protein [Sphaerochaeta sp.]